MNTSQFITQPQRFVQRFLINFQLCSAGVSLSSPHCFLIVTTSSNLSLYYAHHLFEQYTQGLTAAEADGRLPDGVTFDPKDLDQYWATNLDFSILGGPDSKCIETFQSIVSNPDWKLNFVAFSNGPRKYVSRALKEIGLDSFFPPDKLFAVTDVLPYCKPEKESFDVVLKAVGADASNCIMVEDSMKNIRVAKSMGMKTILVVGKGRKRTGGHQRDSSDTKLDKNANNAEKTKAGDAPDETDPAVDAVVEVVSEIGEVLKELMAE